MIGMLLLATRAGRSSGVGATTLASVSDRRNVENRDGGGGRDPVGREKLLLRRLFRYCAT